MRVTITTGGSRGDVQPLVALGVGLQEAGHKVVVAATAPFEGFARGRGLEFSAISGDPQGEVRALLESGKGTVAFLRRWRRNAEPLLERVALDYLTACRDAEAVLYTAPGFLGFKVAQKLGVSAVGAGLQPLFQPTFRFPCALMPTLGGVGRAGAVKGAYNYLSYPIFEQASWQTLRAPTVRALARVGLPVGSPLDSALGPAAEFRRQRKPALFGWSPSVLPPPPRWGGQLITTGYWFLEAPKTGSWRAPQELVHFLKSGPPPVSVGFGSMGGPRGRAAVRAAVDAISRAGLRGVLLSGWSEAALGGLPEGFIQIDEVPHDWLLEKVAAAVHHGGAGTSAAALRAGIPSVTVPFFADQFFWGRRLAELGVATEPVPAAGLSESAGGRASSLADAVRLAVDDAGMRDASRRLGERIRQEDGVARAVAAFERYAQS